MVLNSPKTMSSSSHEQVQHDNISKPRNLKKYLCIRTFSPKTSSEIAVKIGQIVELIHKHPSGWWLVYNYDAQGFVPSSHLIPMHPDVKNGEKEHTDINELFITTKAYRAENSDEISLTAHCRVEVLQKSENGWWLVRCLNSKNSGLYPSIYLRALIDTLPVARQFAVGPSSQWLHFRSKTLKPRPLGDSSSKTSESICKSSNTLCSRQKSGMNGFEYFTAIKNYEDLHGDSLSFCAGQLIKVFEKNVSGWWYAEIEGKYGWIPSSYLQKSETLTGRNRSVPPLPSKPPVIKNNSLLSLLSAPYPMNRTQNNKCTSFNNKSTEVSPSINSNTISPSSTSTSEKCKDLNTYNSFEKNTYKKNKANSSNLPWDTTFEDDIKAVVPENGVETSQESIFFKCNTGAHTSNTQSANAHLMQLSNNETQNKFSVSVNGDHGGDLVTFDDTYNDAPTSRNDALKDDNYKSILASQKEYVQWSNGFSPNRITPSSEKHVNKENSKVNTVKAQFDYDRNEKRFESSENNISMSAQSRKQMLNSYRHPSPSHIKSSNKPPVPPRPTSLKCTKIK